MEKTSRMKNSNNQIIKFMMILGLFTLFVSGCQQGGQPANSNSVNTEKAANEAPKANTNTEAPTANTNAETANVNSTNAESISTTAAANDKCGSPGDDEVIIYEHIFSQDGGGKCVKLQPGEYKDAAAMGLADNIMSSIKVGKNVHAIVCDGTNFTGACDAFDKDDADFRNNPTIKNDIASSIKVVKAKICSPEGEKPVSLRWTNKTNKNLRIVWINTECQERNADWEVKREIKPGQVFDDQSFVGHVFLVSDFNSGEKYGYMYVTDSNAVQDIKDIK